MADTHTRAALRRELERAAHERDRLEVVIAYLQERYDALTPTDPAETPKPPTRRTAKPAKRRPTRVLPLSASIATLKERGSPMTTSDLAEAVRGKGGEVKDIENLYRSLKRGKGVERVGRGLWGLSEWYPNGVPADGADNNGRAAEVEVGSPLSRESDLGSRD
jgi:hypothetical protein